MGFRSKCMSQYLYAGSNPVPDTKLIIKGYEKGDFYIDHFTDVRNELHDRQAVLRSYEA